MSKKTVGVQLAKEQLETFEGLRRLGSCHSYPPGVEICAASASVGQVYVLEEGDMGLYAFDDGGKEVLIGIRKPLWVAGASGFFAKCPLPVALRTLSFCKLRPIPAAALLHALTEDSKISRWLVEILANELSEELSGHSMAVLYDLSNRLQHFIWELCQSCQSGRWKVQWPFSQKTVAEFLGTSETYLSTLMAQLEDSGLIKRSTGWIILPDPSKLWHK